MSRPRQLLSLLSRLGSLSLTSGNRCRFASRGGSAGSWVRQGLVYRDRAAQRYSEDKYDELDEEDVEDKLQVLADEMKKRQKTVKYHILRRQMNPKGAPERKLTWDAIEQIRFLKQEQPEEWTVERLAEGFSVSHDVILRVLRSKFVPSPERKTNQDAKVMAKLSQQVLPSSTRTGQDQVKLPGNRTATVLPSGNTKGPLIPAADQTLMIEGRSSLSLTKSPVPATVLPTQLTARISKDNVVTRATEENINANIDSGEGDTEEGDEKWDGRVWTEEQLEEFMETEQPAPMVQVGNDFFDADGNFLYRI